MWMMLVALSILVPLGLAFFAFRKRAAEAAQRSLDDARADGAAQAENETIAVISEGADAQAENNVVHNSPGDVAAGLRADAAKRAARRRKR